MSYQNISAEISSETIEFLIQKVKEMEEKLPFVINLTPEEIRSLPKMGDKSIPFVEKAMEYAARFPQFLPAYVDLAELKKDLELARKLKMLLNVLEPLTEKVKDTWLEAGAEAYSAARVFYKSTRNAIKSGVPGADTVADELGKRFGRKSQGIPGEEKA